MVEGKPRLLDRFRDYLNWPLRGLFWLSKELFDDQLKHTTGPDARELHDIRNALEHKFLQVHEDWARPFMRAAPSSEGLGFSIDSDFLETKALRVMKIARSALIQLALAVGVEERARARERPGTFVASMSHFGLDDRRKRRDPV
ncbi:LA2681 family HEPN domain-containing protein [Nitrobacter sp. NHB1]